MPLFLLICLTANAVVKIYEAVVQADTGGTWVRGSGGALCLLKS